MEKSPVTVADTEDTGAYGSLICPASRAELLKGPVKCLVRLAMGSGGWDSFQRVGRRVAG